MEIEVLMFAAARELTGCDAVQVEVAGGTHVPRVTEKAQNSEKAQDSEMAENTEMVRNFESATVDELMNALATQFPVLQALLPSCRIAVDCEYVGTETRIAPGAEVALIPPVSGG
jgi:molybdopterin converting factor small subunit